MKSKEFWYTYSAHLQLCLIVLWGFSLVTSYSGVSRPQEAATGAVCVVCVPIVCACGTCMGSCAAVAVQCCHIW